MLSRLELLIDLLHSVRDAALATHSTSMVDFPFASAVPFVTDEHHRPIILISGLAEHSRNLAANCRASLMIAKTMGEGEMARVSLMGEVSPIEADPLLVQRYLRYHPHAERFLQFGDFRFHCFEPVKVLTVGGFGKASWLDGNRLLDAPVVALTEEMDIFAEYEPDVCTGCQLCGIDAFGADVTVDGKYERIRFSTGPVVKEVWLSSFRREFDAWCRSNSDAGR